MNSLIIKILYHLLFFIFTILFLVLGWGLSWKYTLSHIPIVREICGLDCENNMNNVNHK